MTRPRFAALARIAPLALSGVLLGALAGAPLRAETDPGKIAEICAEAAQRYAETYGHPPEREPGVTVVTMYKYTFCPVRVQVPLGGTVRWVNVDKRTSHSTWFRDTGAAESARLFPDETAEQTFTLPGEFDYLCGPHWESRDMVGRVLVTP